MDDSLPRHRIDDQTTLPGLEADPAASAETGTVSAADRLRAALSARDPAAPALAEDAMRAAPSDYDVPLLAALIMLVARQPDRALTYLKRHQKRWVIGKRNELLTALALAQQGHAGRAGSMLEAAGLDTLYRAYGALPIGVLNMAEWLGDRLSEIARKRSRPAPPKPKPAVTKPAKPKPRATAMLAAPLLQPLPDLPRLEADFTTSIEFANADAIRVAGDSPDPDWFRLRGELTRLGLFQGFDELLCLPLLRGVETHWYQVETVRKVLKQYRGRVLLADEVGLGKTIEAGMVVKEYMLRGMAEHVLILTPASLVGQ
jgi:hypothetical protein